MSDTLPKGWTIAKLGKFCKLKNGFAFKKPDYKSSGVPVIRIGNINDGLVTIDNSVKVDKKEIYKDYIINQGDILIAMSGATTGKFGIYNSQELAYQNQRVGKFEFLDKDSINEKLLFYFLFLLKGEILKDSYGGAQPNISSSKIEDFPVPLAPLNEQKRILAKLEQLLTDLDKGIEYLEITKQQLKVHRQAVLKWAFEGKLTNKNVAKGELPKGWEWKMIEDVADITTGVTPLRTNKSYWEKGTIPWITSGALNEEFVTKADEFVTKKAFEETTLKLLPKHTLLLALYGEGKTRGKCSELLIESTTNQAIAGIKLKKEFLENRKFLKWFLFKNYQDIRLLSAGGVQPNLNSTIVKKTRFPFPPPSEQRKIIQEIESRLSVCDKIEETIESSLQQAEALRLSIIKKAFEGKLVPQDPNDEPAEQLLERIKALRHSSAKTTTRVRSQPAATDRKKKGKITDRRKVK